MGFVLSAFKSEIWGHNTYLLGLLDNN